MYIILTVDHFGAFVGEIYFPFEISKNILGLDIFLN